MTRNILHHAIRWVSLVAGAWLGCASPAYAEVVYNYDEHWLFDTTTGLYWQVLQVPSATLIPPTGTIPEFDLVNQLASDAGLPLFQEGEFSPTIANFISFFASGVPAVPEVPIQFSALYSYPHDLPLGGYQYAGFEYTRDPSLTIWRFFTSTTIGLYGPGHPCPFEVCPPTTPAFVYSTVRPTPAPLPAAAWLMLSALALVLVIRTRPALVALRALRPVPAC